MKIEKKFEQAFVACYDEEAKVLRYKGYTGGNAVSLFFFERFGINLAENSRVHEAVCELIEKKHENQSSS